MIKSAAKPIHSGRIRSSSEDDDSDDDQTFWYICGICNQAFQEERKVKKHKKRIHSSKSGQIILLSDKELQPQIILKRSSLEDDIVNGDDGSAQLKEAQCEVRKGKSSSRAGQEFHSSESDPLDPLALENSSTTLLKRKRSSRQSQAGTSTNGFITDTRHELVRRASVADSLLRRGSSAAAAETHPPRLVLSKEITNSNNSHLMIITQNELLPQVKLVRCEQTDIHPAGSSVMLERNNQNDSKDTCSVTVESADEGNDSKGLKKRKRGRPKKDQQELRPDEGEASLVKQNLPSETININAQLKVETCVPPAQKVASNVETPDLKIEGYTLAEEHNSLELAELVDIPDNNDDWFNSSDSPSPSPQPELVPLSMDKPSVSASAPNVQQEQESNNLNNCRLEIEEHKHFEQEMIVPDHEVENVEEEQADHARIARSLRPRKEGQGKHGSEIKIDDSDPENNEKSDDEDEDGEVDQDDNDRFYEEDSSSDPESTSSLTIKKKKPKEEPTDLACKLCGQIYQRVSRFVTHMKTVHQQHVTTNEKRFPCTLCEKDYRYKSDLTRHLRNHEWFASGQGSCTICQRSFATKRSLSYHMGASHANGADPTSGTSPKNEKAKEVKVKKKKPKEEPTDHTCKLCGNIYQLSRPFVIHMKTVHQQHVTTNEKRFPCPLCERDYRNIRELRKHLRKHEWIAGGQASCTICQRSFKDKRSLPYHMATFHSTTATAEFLCSFCGQGFTTQRHLKVHGMKHNEKEFKCEVEGCGATFKTRNQFNMHNGRHSEGRPFKCPHPACTRAFKTRNDMKRHFKPVHQPHLRPYKCPECPKTYKKSETMKQHHRATHLGVKVSFKCETCEKAFGRKDTLQIHELEEHGKPLEKVFECQVCKKQFASNAQLNIHAIIHATSLAYQCATCGKGFKCPSNLATHSASHLSEEEKKWSCEICGKKFALPHHLRQHASAHGGDAGRSRKSIPVQENHFDDKIQDS